VHRAPVRSELDSADVSLLAWACALGLVMTVLTYLAER
jgi:hypothetical protein